VSVSDSQIVASETFTFECNGIKYVATISRASMKLSYRAYEVRCRIQHILAKTDPGEVPGRIEDVVHDALAEHEDDTRRALRREYSATRLPSWSCLRNS
jgi:hypothetical protein